MLPKVGTHFPLQDVHSHDWCPLNIQEQADPHWQVFQCPCACMHACTYAMETECCTERAVTAPGQQSPAAPPGWQAGWQPVTQRRNEILHRDPAAPAEPAAAAVPPPPAALHMGWMPRCLMAAQPKTPVQPGPLVNRLVCSLNLLQILCPVCWETCRM